MFSSTVSSLKTATFCGTTPISRLLSCTSGAIGRPDLDGALVVLSSDSMQLMAVVLPDPFGPNGPRDLAFPNVQTEVVQRHEVAVPLDQVPDADEHFAASQHPSRMTAS